MNARLLMIPALALGVAALAACATGSRETTRFYALDPGQPPSLRALGNNATAAVAYVDVSGPFAGNGFVYQLAGGRWETDPYRQFLVSPADMMTGVIRTWTRESGYYRLVAEPTAEGGQEDLIRVAVEELAGDFRNPAAPRAVVALQVQVLRRTPAGRVVVMSRSFRQAVPFEGRTPEALVAGWNEALRLALSEMLRALASARG